MHPLPCPTLEGRLILKLCLSLHMLHYCKHTKTYFCATIQSHRMQEKMWINIFGAQVPQSHKSKKAGAELKFKKKMQCWNTKYHSIANQWYSKKVLIQYLKDNNYYPYSLGFNLSDLSYKSSSDKKLSILANNCAIWSFHSKS